MSERLSVRIAVLLALAIALSLCPIAFAEADDTIHIRTAQDLMELAKECSLDTWSNGKTVVLDNDISLTDVDFASIPIFNGTFDGGGHTIYDLDLSSAQSPCGFFIETGKDADIRNLNLSGTVSTRGDDDMVGGIAGLNRGMLTACSFSGEVSAKGRVGGIAGRNDATGLISACTASGSVRGLSQTGGIVGENAGAVSSCENRCFVNTESVDPALRLDGIDTSSILNFVKSLRADNAGITTDIGGIAGSSSGFIERCNNVGPVGYLHLGYNVGGIAGRSSGFIKACNNMGEVYGRKDVGGVVGQAEPLLENQEAQDLLAGVSYRLYALNKSFREAAEDARSASEDLSERFSKLGDYLAPVAEAVREIDITDPESIWMLQDVIAGSLYDVRNEAAAIGEDVDCQAGILAEDMQEIADSADALSNTALQTIGSITGKNNTAEDILVDDSESADWEQFTFGKTVDSDNSGSIYGDSNVGGIAGNFSVENDYDPESELSISGNTLNKNKFSLRALVTGCINHGSVTAKRECAGGIAGKMDFGLASHCASYGPVALEDGDYAGGVVGLLYGSVRNCCAKCSLSGKRYIGGIVGNGYKARSGSERPSIVSGCYTLTEILNSPQFAGAVSGGGDGDYENNFFVPEEYAGLDRVSIHGQAEPISFADYAAVEGLPEECKTFTLRFVVDGETVRELPFEYGASFDRSVFPHVAQRNGAYAVWDRTDLTELHFDTTVTANYRMDETVLRSQEERSDGRAAVYVDGQFQQGDALTLTDIPVSEEDIRLFSTDWKETVRAQLRSIFREGDPDYSIPVAVTEHLRVSFPDDGQKSHSLRYLTPDGQTENYRLYLAGDEGWTRIRPQTFGSYFLFEAPGREAEFTLVATIQSWWIVAYIAAAMVILTLLIISIVKLRRWLRSHPKKERPPRAERPFPRWLRAHRKPILITLPILIAAAATAVVVLRFGSIGSAFSAYRVLKGFSQEEADVQTEISVQTAGREVRMSTTVHRVRQNGRMIRCTEQYGIPLYIANGLVCLENGRAFRLAEGRLSQGAVLDLALDVFLHEEVRRTEESGVACYEAVIGGETADRILRLFMSSDGEELLQAESMTVSLRTAEGRLQSLSFTGVGTAAGETPFALKVVLTPSPLDERPAIPQAVLDAIENGGGENTQILSEDLLRLLAAWIKYESAESVGAEINVSADCGSLTLNPRYRYFRRQVEGTDVHCIQSALFKLYFTDDAACTSNGTDLTEAQKRVVDAAQLIPIAREFCLKGRFSCTGTGERVIYTVTLSAEDAADIVSRLLPELDRLNLSYSDCRLFITLDSGSLARLSLECGGSLRVVSRDIDASVRVSADFNADPAGAVPAKVRNALLRAHE